MSNRAPVMTFVVVLVLVAMALAQTFTTLYNFDEIPDGGNPIGALIQDTAGNLYGTTSVGGYGDDESDGVVFEVTTSGTETVLHRFKGSDGAVPEAPLLRDSEGNLYGTTTEGDTSGNGVVFKIETAGKETLLHSFAGGTSDGCTPKQGLVMDEKGNLYGTTEACGAFNLGTVFKLTAKGKETLLHSFAGGASDGDSPAGGRLLMDKAGNLYGVTVFGTGTGCHDFGGCGMVYKLSTNGKLTVLHSFPGGSSDGCFPVGTVNMDKGGNLYGTTTYCGSSNSGTVWVLSTEGKETILHNFAGGASDGCAPQAGVVMDSKGNLYGSTLQCGADGAGTVWELSKKGAIRLLHSFDGADGQDPIGELLRTASGELFGTTSEGGGGSYGTVWSYVP